jgi:hypothetical protein
VSLKKAVLQRIRKDMEKICNKLKINHKAEEATYQEVWLILSIWPAVISATERHWEKSFECRE